MVITFIMFLLFIISLGVLSIVFWIWMLVDCINNKYLSDTTKAVWVLVIVLTHFIGAFCYLFAGRKPATTGPPKGTMYQGARVMPQQYPAAAAPPYPPASRNAAHIPPSQAIYQPGGPQAGYTPYQQGYQPPQVAGMHNPEIWRQAEEPLATYPDLPQQEMPQQEIQQQANTD